ncbi:hypothetical protein TNCV_572621 [Trichonephila clavipes]|nr:hypothetical protein TNCV_572621 [Trichonephila clavipes]
MNRKINELKDQYYAIKDIRDSELEVIEADLQGMEDRLEVRIIAILNSLIAISSVHNGESKISQAYSKLKLEKNFRKFLYRYLEVDTTNDLALNHNLMTL